MKRKEFLEYLDREEKKGKQIAPRILIKELFKDGEEVPDEYKTLMVTDYKPSRTIILPCGLKGMEAINAAMKNFIEIQN